MQGFFPALDNQNVNSSHADSPEHPPTHQQKIWEVANGPEQINEVSPEQEEAESTEIYNRQGQHTEQASNKNTSANKAQQHYMKESFGQRPEDQENLLQKEKEEEVGDNVEHQDDENQQSNLDEAEDQAGAQEIQGFENLSDE